MIDLRFLSGRTVGIYGAGSTGLAVHAALRAAGAHVCFWEDDPAVRKKLSSAGITCQSPDDWPWDTLECVVPSFTNRAGFVRATKILDLAGQYKVPVRSDLDLFGEAIASRPAEERPLVVGITGTHGKSLTASLIAHILNASGWEAHLGGSAGRPVLSLPAARDNGVYVVEVLPQTLAFTKSLRCDAGILTNLTPLDVRYFKSADQAVRAATRIFRNQEMDDALVIGVDDLLSQKICTAITSGATGNFGSENIIAVSGEATLGLGIFSLDGRVFDARADKTASLGNVSRAPAIIGSHFNQAVASAFAACLHIGLSASLISRAVLSWPGLPGRFYCMGDADGAVFFDDGAATSVAATGQALKSGEDIIWIGGGEDRQRDYEKLREDGDGVLKAFLYGPAAGAIEKATRRSFDTQICADAEAAVAAALDEARAMAEREEGVMPMVLFSPGCPGAIQRKAHDAFIRQVSPLLGQQTATGAA